MLEQKQEIHATRTGGLGGSDAKMVLKVGVKGIESLSQTDLRRLAVMTGQIEYVSKFVNDSLERGNEFERWVHENVYDDRENNPLIELPYNPYSFRVFAHADFELDGRVDEAKCTNKMIEDTEIDYIAQLQWYYMLGAKSVYLVHSLQDMPFDDYNIEFVEKDNRVIDNLIKGLKFIDEFIKDFTYIEKEEWTVNDLIPYEQEEVEKLYSALTEIKQLEEQAEQIKQSLKEIFKTNGVKSIKSDYYSITYVPESISNTFDKKKLLKDYPEINEADYLKTSKKSDYLKIITK